MLEVICVMAAGAIGALSRWGTDNLFKHYLGPAFPYGTLCVNVLGCFIFGAFMQFDQQSSGVSKYLRLLVTTGFLGAFTTFSTFGYHSYSFFKNGDIGPAAVNIIANVVAGLLAVWGGATLAKVLG